MSTRVAVTTSVDRYERWAAEVLARGHEPVRLPCIEVRPLPGVERLRRAAVTADLLVITSGRTVEFMWPAATMPPVGVAAVGRATARTVERSGGRVDFVGDGDGDDLVDLLADVVADKMVVFPHAAGSDLSRIDRLKNAGATVISGPVYESVPVAPGPDPVDATVFGSPSAITGWLLSRSVADAGVVAAIGATTAGEWVRHGGTPPSIPSTPDLADLVEALERKS